MEIFEKHVTFELESIELYLKGYVPGLQTPEAVAYFLRKHRGAEFASSVLLDEISRDFARRIERFADGIRSAPSPGQAGRQGAAVSPRRQGAPPGRTVAGLQDWAPALPIVIVEEAQDLTVASPWKNCDCSRAHDRTRPPPFSLLLCGDGGAARAARAEREQAGRVAFEVLLPPLALADGKLLRVPAAAARRSRNPHQPLQARCEKRC